MLTNNKQREQWFQRELKKEDNVVLEDSNAGIKLIRVQINEDLYFNEIKVLTKSYLVKGKLEYVTAHCYCSKKDGIRYIDRGAGYVPTSEAQVVLYLKDYRNDEFVRGLSL